VGEQFPKKGKSRHLRHSARGSQPRSKLEKTKLKKAATTAVQTGVFAQAGMDWDGNLGGSCGTGPVVCVSSANHYRHKRKGKGATEGVDKTNHRPGIAWPKMGKKRTSCPAERSHRGSAARKARYHLMTRQKTKGGKKKERREENMRVIERGGWRSTGEK